MFLAHLLNRVTNRGREVSIFLSYRSSAIIGGCLLVAAEYLAKGYKLSDGILQRAIQLDCKLGSYLLSFLLTG